MGPYSEGCVFITFVNSKDFHLLSHGTFVAWFACKLIATLNSATKAEFRHSGAFGCLGKLLNAKKVTALKPLWNKFILATGGEGAVQWGKSFGEIIQRAIYTK